MSKNSRDMGLLACNSRKTVSDLVCRWRVPVPDCQGAILIHGTFPL